MSSDLLDNWHLHDWARYFGKKQADLVRDLGWNKSKVCKLWNNEQPYRRADLVALSRYFRIEPFELLMPPTRALAFRNLRESAARIVESDTQDH